MSLVFDKGKFRYYKELDQNKSKINNSHVNLSKNNPKKNNLNNNQLFNDYETSSPFRNINNNKKNTFLTTYQNYSNITNSHRDQNHNNKKGINSKKLKYNKSFEGNLMNNDLIFSNNFDLANDDIYNNDKIQGNKKFNNSVILNNKPNRTKNKNKSNNKSVTRTINAHTNMNNKKNKLDENFIIKKLDEKFKSLENNIIDKKYENDIDHDEMIISTNKKHTNKNKNFNGNTHMKTTNKIKNKSFNLSDMIDGININSMSNKNDYKNKEDIIDKIFFDFFNNNKTKIDLDENYLLNSSFENNRSDFNIMYTDNYGDTVPNDMISLEIKLLIEKMLELQKSYHNELKLIINQYNNNQALFSILIEKIKYLQKKIFLIKKIQESKSIKGNIFNFIGVYNHNNQHEINKINKKEFLLWNKIMQNNDDIEYNKEKIKELFTKIIFDKYNKISGKINNIENKIIINLMKKYKYNLNNKKNDGIIKYNGSIGDIYNDKNKNTSPTHYYKNMIKQNNKYINNSNTTINKKKKHKKTASCCVAKPSRYIYFKNIKQK